MSELILKRISQLEKQNQNLRRLLRATRQITNESSEKCAQLTKEANLLKQAVEDLERQKEQLEAELAVFVKPGQDDYDANFNIQDKLNNALNDIQIETSDVAKLQTEDDLVKESLRNLELGKEQLLRDIKMVRDLNEQTQSIVNERIKLKQELALLMSSASPGSIHVKSCVELVHQIEDIIKTQDKLRKEIEISKTSNDPFGVGTENTVLEIKIAGLEKQKENLMKTLRASLLRAANEVTNLHNNSSDIQLRGLVNELELHRTILMLNIGDIRQLHESKSIAGVPDMSGAGNISSLMSTASSELIQSITDVDDPTNNGVRLSAVTEEYIPSMSIPADEEESLVMPVTLRVEHTHADTNEVGTLREDVRILCLDDATNQFMVDEARHVQVRIIELAEDAQRIADQMHGDVIPPDNFD